MNIYKDLKTQVENSSGIEKSFLDKAIEAKLENLRKDREYTHALYDRYFFSDLKKQSFGNSLKFFCVTGPNLPRDVQEFLSIVLSCPVCNAYSCEEIGGLAAIQVPEDLSVGLALSPNIEIKLINVLETTLRYSIITNTKPPLRGDLCLRGPSLSKEYHQDANQTKLLVDKEGWFTTSDICDINDDGSLSIVGNKADMIETFAGRFVSPKKIEMIYLRCKYVSDIFVYGTPNEEDLIAVIMPDKNHLEELASLLKISQDFKGICKSVEIKDFILREFSVLGESELLENFEQVKKIYIDSHNFAFHQFYGPMMQLQRDLVAEHYQKHLKKLFQKVRFTGTDQKAIKTTFF